MTAALPKCRDETPLGDDSLLANPLFGGGLPPLAEWNLHEAGLNYAQAEIAESHLRRAAELAPDHFAVLIGFYRYYFYKGRLSEALVVCNVCLAKAAREKNFSVDWRLVRPEDGDFGSYDDLVARFYMFCLKGYAYLHMRLGDLEEGRAAIVKLLELDASDKINARLLFDILDRAANDEDHEDASDE